ncbi:YjbF family lipoprotein [Oceaniglobus roseus]|uniref:YjbF family lipoprotein n=1 Tax=Oceaniglobus roseus TaxID=1737570 RepID=UPI000C7EC370|nr:YjbF family lipoprotein [Kandeliimicrobium roseum]
MTTDRRSGASLRAIALFALAALAGCGTDGSGVIGAAAKVAVGSLRGADASVGKVTATDAALRNFGAPLVKVTQLKNGFEAVIGIVSERGDTVIWESADQKQITLRRGILVGTTGFAYDMTSAEEPDIRKGSGEVVRDHYYLGGDELIYRARFFCNLASPGRQRIVVTGVAIDTRLITETCEGRGLRFENRYWVEGDGTIRKSVQWASEATGALQIELIPQGRAANVAQTAAAAAAAPAAQDASVVISE